MILPAVLLVVGVALSALFSGAETGFYRASRVRMVLDGLGGDLVSRVLLSFTNHPSIFVATVLVGNNLANYVTSAAVVLGAHALFDPSNHWAELVAPLLLAPLLFLFGELLPKNLFHEAPNRLLRRSGLALMAATLIFLPVTAVLWGLSKLLERLSGVSPERVQLALARRELHQVFDEGHEAGILHAAQRGLAQGLIAVAGEPVAAFVIPAGRVPRVRAGTSRAEILRLARRQRLTAVPIEEAGGKRRLVGYVRTADLYLEEGESDMSVRPLVEIADTESHLSALMRLTSADAALGRVADRQGRTVGFVTPRLLSEPLFRGQ